MKRHIIAHVLWHYLPKPHGYIYNQISRLRSFDSVVLCEQFFYPSPPAKVAAKMYNGGKPLTIRSLTFKTLRRLWTPGYARWFERKALRSGASLVHVHFGIMARVLATMPRKFRLPVVVTFYGNDASQDLMNHKSAYQRLFSFADAILVQGETIRERFLSAGCEPGRLHVWDVGIDISRFPYFPRDENVRTVKFLIAARFVEKKGHFILLEAFRKLLQNHSNIHLTMIGFGPLETRIRSYITEHHLDNLVQVINTDEVDDFYSVFCPILQSHDIFILPSVPSSSGDEDGLPVVIQDAQAAGLPVITCPVGAIPRAVKQGLTGLLATPGSVDSLASQMDHLLQNREIWNRIGEKARHHAEEFYSLDRQIERLESIYMNCIQRTMKST